MFFLRPVTRTSRRNRRLGQSLVEFALVAPLLLLVFAAAADLGRAFYGYVAVENAAKEGAFYGSRVPLCDDDSAPQCANPNNVKWRVQKELEKQRVFDTSGNPLVPTTPVPGTRWRPSGDAGATARRATPTPSASPTRISR